jgi:hypothetical protein
MLERHKPILSTVSSSSWKACGHGKPVRPGLCEARKQSFLFDLRPFGGYQFGIDGIDPLFATLSGNSAWTMQSDLFPVSSLQDEKQHSVKETLQRLRISISRFLGLGEPSGR